MRHSRGGPGDEPSPRPLLDKLGVRMGARVLLVGMDEAWFLDLVRERTLDVSSAAPDGLERPERPERPEGPEGPEGTIEIVFLAADRPADLEPLRSLVPRITRAGAIWVVSRKGRAATLRDVEVIGAAVSAGLVDNKVVAFSPTHTALRLVIPRALR